METIVSIWNPKGGQGKSMLAINIAAAAVKRGLTPLVICQDTQGTSIGYGQDGDLPFRIEKEPPQKIHGIDIVLFDEQASSWELPDSGYILMPVKPTRDQHRTYAQALSLAKEGNKRVLTVVTDVDIRRRSEHDVALALMANGALPVYSSSVFGRAANQYRSIFHPALDIVYRISTRRDEMLNILDALLRGDAHA